MTHLGRCPAPAAPCTRPSRFWPRQLACIKRGLQTRCRAAQRDLWEYDGTHVQSMNLDTLKALHRLSYGHRARRSVVVVIYDPADAACRQSEPEIERLASGLQHERQLLVAKLNVRTAHMAPGNRIANFASPASTVQFLSSITEAASLPVVLLYPEGAPGLMRYQVPGPLTAESLCSALNSCQLAVLPSRPPLKLLSGPASPEQASATAAPAQDNTQATTTATSTTTTTSTTSTTGGSPAVSKTVLTQTTPAWNRPGSYWTTGKIWFWSFIAVSSVALLVWEKWLGPTLELRAFNARQAARASGQGAAELFDSDTNLDDLFRLRTLAASQAAQGASSPLRLPLGILRPNNHVQSTEKRSSESA